MAMAFMDDQDDIQVETISGGVALEAVDRAAVDIQIQTAKRFPRSVTRSLQEALSLATLDEDTAASMFYSLPRSGKKIEGPSARLAEIMAYSWGNLRVDADIVAEDRTHITAMGTCFDLERNVAVRVRVKRRITTKSGKRYDDDMIVVTGNAAISIALRNAVFKVIPAALVRNIYQAARKASIGQGGTLAQKRQKALAWFAKAGATEQQVFGVLDIAGLDDLGEEELVTLRGLMTAIKDGDTTVEEAFQRPSSDASEDVQKLNEQVHAQQKAKPAAPEPAATPETKPAEAGPPEGDDDPGDDAGADAEESFDPAGDLVDLVIATKPKGGTATDAQRDRLRQIAAELFPEGTESRALIVSFADAPELGRGQAGKAVAIGKIAIAQQAAEADAGADGERQGAAGGDDLFGGEA